MTTRRRKRVPRTLKECHYLSDLLLPHIARELKEQQAKEQRLAEEAEDRYYDEMSDELEAHPIGLHGHTPHGCT